MAYFPQYNIYGLSGLIPGRNSASVNVIFQKKKK